MKSVSRNKFLLCCRPVVLDMEQPAGRAITYIAGKSSNGSSAADLRQPVATCPPKRTLSRVIRAVLFEIILSKSVRDKRGLRSSKRNKMLSREGSSSSCSSYASDENKTEEVVDRETKSDTVAAETCSVTEWRNGSKDLRMRSKRSQSVAARQCLNSGMFLFLISLTITVLWGKLWAILLTSLWSYFLPLPGGVAGKWWPETVAARFGKGSYYKKKVVLEK